MMQQNRLAYAYLASVIGITAIAVGSLVYLRANRVEVDQLLLGQITAICVPSLVSLLALLRGIGNSQQIQQTTDHVQQLPTRSDVQQAAAQAVETARVDTATALTEAHNEGRANPFTQAELRRQRGM